MANSARFVLRTVQQAAEKGGESLTVKFSEVARMLLTASWDTLAEYPALAANAVGLVAARFGASPSESKTLLMRLLAEQHFSNRAHDEGRELADKIIAIASSDPAFAVEKGNIAQLEAACRLFDSGGQWGGVKASLSS